MDVLSVWMSVYHMSAWCPWRWEEGIRSPRTGVTMVITLHLGARNWTFILWKNRQPSNHWSISSSDSSLVLNWAFSCGYSLCISAYYYVTQRRAAWASSIFQAQLVFCFLLLQFPSQSPLCPSSFCKGPESLPIRFSLENELFTKEIEERYSVGLWVENPVLTT